MNLNSLSFAQLQRFLELARQLHFTRAAETLGIAQPLLSEQIRALEHLLGLRLFDRTSRRVSLTPAGIVFRDRVQLIVEGMRAGVHAAKAEARGEMDRLRLGYTDEYSSDFLPECIRFIRDRRPGAGLELTLAMTPRLMELLQTGLVDGVFVCPIPDEPAGPEFATVPLPSLPLSVALPADHALASRTSVAIPALKRERFIEGPTSPPTASERVVNRLFARHGIQRQIAQRADDLQLSLSLVASGMGAMIGYFAANACHRKDIVVVPLDDPHASLTRSFAWRTSPGMPVLDELLGFLGERAAA
jgi:DNA-binding transcriptional LysR family regulator